MILTPLTTHAPVPPFLSVGRHQADLMVPEIIILTSAVILSSGLYAAGSYRALAVMIPLIMIVVNAAASYRMIKADPAMLVTPLFGARLIALVVFGIGGLFDAFAPWTARLEWDWLYPVTEQEAARTNLLWLLGMTLLLAGVMVAMCFPLRSSGDKSSVMSLRSVPFTVGLSLFLGGSVFDNIRIVFELPVPGVLATLVLAFQLCGLFMIAQHAGSSNKARLVLVFGLLWLFLLSILYAAKTLFLYPALVAALGVLSDRVTWRRALAGGMLVMMAFFISQPFVDYMRSRFRIEYGVGSVPPFEDRVQYMIDYIGGDRITEKDSVLSLGRINYVMPASLVMTLHDQGMASERLANAAFIFVPRMLWPDKPSTTTSGFEVNYALGLQSENQIGMTMFADLYWNIGWFGLALVPLVGLYFGFVTVICHGIVSRGQWIMLPFALASLRLSLNLDNDFPAAIMAPAILNILLFYFLRLVSNIAEKLPALQSEPIAALR